MHAWYAAGGYAAVTSYLHAYDLSTFNPHASPLKTVAFWEMVNADRTGADAELDQALEDFRRPPVIVVEVLRRVAAGTLQAWFDDPKNHRNIPKRLELCGYVRVPNPDETRGRWKKTIGASTKQVSVYGRRDLAPQQRVADAAALEPDSLYHSLTDRQGRQNG